MKKKVKANKPKESNNQCKSAEDVLNNIDGITEIIVVDDDAFDLAYDIAYDEALLEEAAILSALEDEGYYDVVLTDCGC